MTAKQLVSFLSEANSWKGMNKQTNPKKLINRDPIRSDSYITLACITITDLLTLEQCYSNRYQNILMQWNTGWNIIAPSQPTETSWDNCIAKENWLSHPMPFRTLKFVFSNRIICCNNGLMVCIESMLPILCCPVGSIDCIPSAPIMFSEA